MNERNQKKTNFTVLADLKECIMNITDYKALVINVRV